jgi:hypothetical protein
MQKGSHPTSVTRPEASLWTRIHRVGKIFLWSQKNDNNFVWFDITACRWLPRKIWDRQMTETWQLKAGGQSSVLLIARLPFRHRNRRSRRVSGGVVCSSMNNWGGWVGDGSNKAMRRWEERECAGGQWWVMDVLQPISYLYHATINHAIF